MTDATRETEHEVQEPVYHNRELCDWSDTELLHYTLGVHEFFDYRAQADRCEGDLFGGWDWSTMNVVHPELCTRYRNAKAEALRRLDASGGLFAGVRYVRTLKGWKVQEPDAN